MAGFRPGLGRGGMTHSLVVMEIGAWAGGGPGIGEMTDAIDILSMGAGVVDTAAVRLEVGSDFLTGAG